MSTVSGTADLVNTATQAAMKTRYGDTARFAKSKSKKSQDSGSCGTYTSNTTCTNHIKFPMNPDKQRCSWCVNMTKNAFGVMSRCVSCSEVAKMEALHFSCSTSAIECRREEYPDEKKIKDLKPLDKRT